QPGPGPGLLGPEPHGAIPCRKLAPAEHPGHVVVEVRNGVRMDFVRHAEQSGEALGLLPVARPAPIHQGVAPTARMKVIDSTGWSVARRRRKGSLRNSPW